MMDPGFSQTRVPSATMMDPKSSKELPKSLKKFYKGEPLALGITQLLLGFLEIMFALMLHLSYEDIFNFSFFLFMTPYWTGMAFLVTGLLSVAAAIKPNPSLVKSILGMNVLSVVVASFGIICLSLTLVHGPWIVIRRCSSGGSLQVDPQCYATRLIPFNIVRGIMSIFLVFSVLEFCINISSAAFGCKTLCRDTFTEEVEVVYQSVPAVNSAYLPVAHQSVPPDTAVSLPGANEDAENLLNCYPFSPPGLPPLAPTSEPQGLDEGILHNPESVDPAAGSDDVDSKL